MERSLHLSCCHELQREIVTQITGHLAANLVDTFEQLSNCSLCMTTAA